MLVEHEGKRPVVAESAYVAPTAVVSGDVPIGWIAVGDPAQLFPPDQHDLLWPIQRELDFPGTVFGVPRAPNAELMPVVTERYADLFGRHLLDRVIDE